MSSEATARGPLEPGAYFPQSVCSGYAQGGTPPPAIYLVPAAFQAEPGTPTSAGQRIEAPEFSFILTGEHLAKVIPGFSADRPRRSSQDTMVIVKVYDAAAAAECSPPPGLIAAWEDIWRRTGSRKPACTSRRLGVDFGSLSATAPPATDGTARLPRGGL